MIRAAWLVLVALLLTPAAAVAAEEGEGTDPEESAAPAESTTAEVSSKEEWVPGSGERTALTRTGPDFRGMGFLFPVRLHLSLGGHIDGKIAGLEEGSGDLMLVLPLTQFRVHTSLVTAVTPRGNLPPPGSAMADRLPPPLVSQKSVYKLKPTWRSGVGMALNILAPGTGSFIQKKEQSLGFLFLGLDIFFLSAGALAAFAPSRLQERERAFFGIIFFAFDGLTRAAGGAQAFAAGRERTLVPVRVPGNATGPGLAGSMALH
ncbi:MAG: hypothetical protein KDA24_14105 [Deltaproteobacteria bacterium]|nr:hypothetical protein [Deltaproteobacteria bacterium]